LPIIFHIPIFGMSRAIDLNDEGRFTAKKIYGE
jgi:hypothetical protein